MKRHGQRFGRHELSASRKLSSGDLQLLILALLENSPAHGYELIKLFEAKSDGFYVPSPGMIYPSLTYLTEMGYADVHEDGTKRRYSLTAAGIEYLEQNRESAAVMLDHLVKMGARMEDARRAFAGGGSQDEETGRQSAELRQVRNELKTFLRTFEPTSLEDDARVAKLLRGALAQSQMIVRDSGRAQIDQHLLLRVMAERRSMGLSRLRPDDVDEAVIWQMLEAANWAPSHKDTEPWRFTVFTGEGRERLGEIFALASGSEEPDLAAGRKRAFAAPVWISIGMTPQLKEDGSLLMSEEEELMAVACAVQNLHLMASAMGLAGMWHSKGSSVHPAVAEALGLTPPSRLLGFFMCGWPAGEWLTSTRRPIEEKVTWVN